MPLWQTWRVKATTRVPAKLSMDPPMLQGHAVGVPLLAKPVAVADFIVKAGKHPEVNEQNKAIKGNDLGAPQKGVNDSCNPTA